MAAALDLRLHSRPRRRNRDALDNLCDSTGALGVGDGNVLHRRWVAPPLVGLCVDRHGGAPDSGTQSRWLVGWSGRGNTMPLLSIVVTLVVIGVVMYLINRYIPMASGIKNLLNVVVVILAAVWVLQ